MSRSGRDREKTDRYILCCSSSLSARRIGARTLGTRVFCHCSCGLGARVREAEGSRGAAKSLEAARRQAKRDYTAVTTAYPVSDRSLPTLACALVTRERRARALGTLACITFCVRALRACVCYVARGAEARGGRSKRERKLPELRQIEEI